MCWIKKPSLSSMPCYTINGTTEWTTPTITRTDNPILTIGQTDSEALPEFVLPVPVVAGPLPLAEGPFTDCE